MRAVAECVRGVEGSREIFAFAEYGIREMVVSLYGISRRRLTLARVPRVREDEWLRWTSWRNLER